MCPDQKKEPLSLVAALFYLGFLTIGEIITIAFFAWPDSSKELALLTAEMVALDLTGLAVKALWNRSTRKRRQFRITG